MRPPLRGVEDSAAGRVLLTEAEAEAAAEVGRQRRRRSLEAGRKDAHGLRGTPEDLEAINIQGALAEAAFAKALEVEWHSGLRTSIEEFHRPDAGRYQVRSTPRRTGRLIVHPEESNEDPFVLLIGKDREWRVAGWRYGHECKRPEWRFRANGRPAAYFVPQEALRPLKKLSLEDCF